MPLGQLQHLLEWELLLKAVLSENLHIVGIGLQSDAIDLAGDLVEIFVELLTKPDEERILDFLEVDVPVFDPLVE